MANASDATAPTGSATAATPPRPTRPPRIYRILRSLKNHWAWVTSSFLVGCVVALAAVWWLGHADTLSQEETVDAEKEWAAKIAQYGIKPVFPPEEDFAVGDLFAYIVSDDDPDLNIQDRVTENTPFRARSVKLDHVDVRKALEQIYLVLPFFGDITPAVGPAGGEAEFDLFRHTRRALPIAAFPGIARSNTQNVAGGLSVIRGFLGFGSGSEQSERLSLEAIETYGLPSVQALDVLSEHCANSKAKICLDNTARKHLRSIVGDRVFSEYLDRTTREPRHTMAIRIFMVNRVYLTRKIVNTSRAGRVISGGMRLPIGGEPLAAPPNTPAPAATPVADASGPVVAMQKRVDELEKQLSSMRQGFAASYGSSANRELDLDQTFVRPVAIGYRYVSYEPGPD